MYMPSSPVIASFLCASGIPNFFKYMETRQIARDEVRVNHYGPVSIHRLVTRQVTHVTSRVTRLVTRSPAQTKAK